MSSDEKFGLFLFGLTAGVSTLYLSIGKPNKAAESNHDSSRDKIVDKDADKRQVLKNWAGNLTFSASNIVYPSSLSELKDIVRKSSSLRVVGTAHSFNGIADTTQTLVSLSRMPYELQIGDGHVWVSAQATYAKLATDLLEKGLTLRNFASLPHISIAGSVATATHGSGVTNQNLATQVIGLEIVLASGEVKIVEKGDADFDGMVVSLGALGIFTKIKLRTEASFHVYQQVYTSFSFHQVIENFHAIVSKAYSVSIFTRWRGDLVDQVWLKERVADDVTPFTEETWFGGRRATSKMHPISELSAEPCSEQLGKRLPAKDVLPHFKPEFTPSAGAELQSEFFVSLADAPRALQALFELREAIAELVFVTELRTVKADDLWLSMNYQQDGLGIHFTWQQRQPEVEALLPHIEQALAPFSPRPHWAKLFSSSAKHLQSVYPKLSEFKALSRRLDPQGKFVNEALRSWLGL